jgi:stage III sporulation protein SpoIIIAA
LFLHESDHSEPRPAEVSRPARQMVIVDDLDLLMSVLPRPIQEWVKGLGAPQDLLEVVMDFGRAPQARFRDHEEVLKGREVTEDDIEAVVSRLGSFGDDNRAGIERTLHRISCLRNRAGRIVGLTCRVGRAVYGTIRIIQDLVTSGRSVLLLGRPGVGKTTMLREVARVLADDAHNRVIVVDTSNEIAGDGDIPHSAIGSARRMQVKTPTLQHAVMIEAVENHMPQVIIIDEMGTEPEAMAARTIAERGVQLIATAHGNTLENLVLNPTLSDLVGGVQSVTLGDDEARRRGTQKAILERKAPPTFDVVVEIQTWDRVAVHDNVSRVVDMYLRGLPIVPETRWLDEPGRVVKVRETPSTTMAHSPVVRTTERAPVPETEPGAEPPQKLFLFGVRRDRVEEAAQEAGVTVNVVNELRVADVVLTTKTHYRRGSRVVKAAEEASKPVYVLRKNTAPHVQQFLKARGGANGADPKVDEALQEAHEAAQRVMEGDEDTVTLLPQAAYIRRLQHMLAAKYSVTSRSAGREPQRHVTFARQ